MEDTPPQVFLSYSRTDLEIAKQVRTGLAAANIRVWMDDEIPPGTPWDEAIATGIRESRLLVVLISANTVVKPKEVKREMAVAEGSGVPVLPVRVDGSDWGTTFAYLLANTQWADISHPPLDAALLELSACVKRLLVTQTANAPKELAPPPSVLSAAPQIPDLKGKKVTLIYKRNAKPDEDLLTWLEQQFAPRGCEVFSDRHLKIGVAWVAEIERKVRESDAVIPLLSASSIQSEMLEMELRIAHDEQQKRNGLPLLLPVRVTYEGPLPASLEACVGELQYFSWKGTSDNQALLNSLLATILHPPGSLSPEERRRLQMPNGAVPLDSQYYVARPADDIVSEAVERRESIILVKGARQMGKTSLITRGIRLAREQRMSTAMLDCQKLNNTDLSSLRNFYTAIADYLCDHLNIEASLGQAWDELRAPNANFERFIIRQVLRKAEQPVLWVLDEVDRLFGCDFSTEVFGLIRSWHNERADPESPFYKLTMMISFATEPSLFISDMNQSPFNVGRNVLLDDFTLDQVSDLNRRYGSPVDVVHLQEFIELLGGQPFLTRRALHEMAVRQLTFSAIKADADRDEGIFGDHLRRFYVVLIRDKEMLAAMRAFLFEKLMPCYHEFVRLRSGGLLKGESREEATIRCGLYDSYLRRHLA